VAPFPLRPVAAGLRGRFPAFATVLDRLEIRLP
jgi:hypothetical protein